jgi:hypothetical protein
MATAATDTWELFRDELGITTGLWDIGGDSPAGDMAVAPVGSTWESGWTDGSGGLGAAWSVLISREIQTKLCTFEAVWETEEAEILTQRGQSRRKRDWACEKQSSV